MTIRFDGQVAIVTGAGQGLGRSHALELARRGARVVVNDRGGAVDGTGSSSTVAESVVREIAALGGEALADAADVTDCAQVSRLVDTVLQRWGRVDILVNNAGILRDKTFGNMSLENFRAVVEVHLFGSVNCTKAVWEIMRRQHYGRIVLTTSSSGLYGNFGQSNYAAAKLALVGLMNTLHLEGAKYDVKVNCLAPCAGTRMLAGLASADTRTLLAPESVTPGLIYLVSREAPSRIILAAGAGGFARARILETEGIFLAPHELTAEAVAANWERICAPESQQDLQHGGEQSSKFLQKATVLRGG